MKAKIKICNPNGCGANSFETYETIKDLKTWLNSALYYSGEVLLNVPALSNFVKYSEINDVAALVREAVFFGEYLEIIPTFEQ